MPPPPEPRATGDGGAVSLALLVHTDRCQTLELQTTSQTSIPDLKRAVEAQAQSGALFRISGRPKGEQPRPEEERRLVFHGQVLEDYTGAALLVRSQIKEAELKRLSLESRRQLLRGEAAECNKRLAQNGLEGGEAAEADLLVAAHERLHREEKETGKELEVLEKQLRELRKREKPMSVGDYHVPPGALLHIVSAEPRLNLYALRVSYVGETLQQRHYKCERVGHILEAIEKAVPRLPKTSDDFRVRKCLYAPGRKAILDQKKCLCEYGLGDAGHELEFDVVMSPKKESKSQLGMTGRSRLRGVVRSKLLPRRPSKESSEKLLPPILLPGERNTTNGSSSSASSSPGGPPAREGAGDAAGAVAVPGSMVPKCIICQDAVAECIAYPCGHRCFCESDAARAREAKLRSCPLCKREVSDIIRVY